MGVGLRYCILNDDEGLSNSSFKVFVIGKRSFDFRPEQCQIQLAFLESLREMGSEICSIVVQINQIKNGNVKVEHAVWLVLI